MQRRKIIRSVYVGAEQERDEVRVSKPIQLKGRKQAEAKLKYKMSTCKWVIKWIKLTQRRG